MSRPPTARRWREEFGQVTPFVVVFVAAMLLIAGLVIDGGLALAAKVRAIDEAPCRGHRSIRWSKNRYAEDRLDVAAIPDPDLGHR